MKQSIYELIDNIKKHPESYYNIDGTGIQKGLIEIRGYGNTNLLSTIEVYIRDHPLVLTYIDRWYLESTIRAWYNNVDLEHLTKKLPE